jgi:hypothetical protein
MSEYSSICPRRAAARKEVVSARLSRRRDANVSLRTLGGLSGFSQDNSREQDQPPARRDISPSPVDTLFHCCYGCTSLLGKMQHQMLTPDETTVELAQEFVRIS